MLRRCLVVALWSAACATPPPPAPASVPTASVAPVAVEGSPQVRVEPAYDQVGKAETFLAAGWQKQERRRARLAKVPPIYWDLDAAKGGDVSVPGSDETFEAPGSEVVVVERHPEHLRIVHDNQEVRLACYAPVTAFHEVIRESGTLLQSDGKPFARGCGVSLPAGAVVTAQAPRVGFRRVEYRSDLFVARGFLRTDQVDRVYLASEKTEPEHRCDCEVESPITLRDGPSGEVVAELTDDDEWYCQQRESPQGGSQKIAVFDGAITIVGFAPSAAITAIEPAEISRLSGTGRGGGWGASHATYVYLWPGDALYRDDGDDQVGQVLARALKVSRVGKKDDGMPLVSLPIYPWDFTTFGIQPDTLRAAREKYEAWLGRVRFDKLTVTGRATVAEVKRELDWDRSGVAECFDEALADQPGASFRYDVDIEYAPKRPNPTLKSKGEAHEDLEGCLALWLRSRNQSLHGTRARFTLLLAPAGRVD